MAREQNPVDVVLPEASSSAGAAPGLARRLGLFDSTMIVMGGIVGSGIFINPYVVARQVRTPALILGAWALGGLIALGGAFAYAELAALRPEVGGQYAYLREAYHPAVAFVYGWALLLVTQTGGMAAVAVTFAHYFLELAPWPIAPWAVATLALAGLTLINCLGVRAGSTTQSALMVTKIVAIAALVVCGWLLIHPARGGRAAVLDRPPSLDLVTAMGAAMVPVLFAYGGWQTSSFIAGEMREPERNLPRGLLMGVLGVIVLYLAVNFVSVRALGPDGLAGTTTPASEVMRLALGQRGAALIAVGIAVSTLGFLSQSILTAPRVYFAMATDGVFFKRVAWLHPRTRVPVVAIALQGVLAVIIAVSGKYEQILNYVVSTDFVFFGLTATCIFAFRRRGAQPAGRVRGASAHRPRASQRDIIDGRSVVPRRAAFRMPGHPVTTVLFTAACWLVVLNTLYRYPKNSAIGLGIVLAGIPVYFLWGRERSSA
jgi:basic amino acid/polyamine antiporter, APA family